MGDPPTWYEMQQELARVRAQHDLAESQRHASEEIVNQQRAELDGLSVRLDSKCKQTREMQACLDELAAQRDNAQNLVTQHNKELGVMVVRVCTLTRGLNDAMSERAEVHARYEQACRERDLYRAQVDAARALARKFSERWDAIICIVREAEAFDG